MYAKPGLVSIYSLLISNLEESELNIYYIENNISEHNKNEIIKLVNEYNRNIYFIPMPDLSKYATGLLRTNEIVYSYCFLQNILPDNIDRILLIECDAIALRSLKDLYNIDINDYYIAAADDVKSTWYKKALGLKEDSIYINSGVMLLNLKKMRHDNITPKMTELLSSKSSNLFYEVQDEINVVFESKIKILPPKYNCTTALFLYNYKNMKRYRRPSSCFSEDEYRQAVTKPYIVHFTTNQIIQSRPWIDDCVHPYKKVYDNLKNHTSWSDSKLWKSNRGIKNKIAYGFYKYTPKAFNSFVLGLVQAYLYPMWVYYRHRNKSR